MNERKLPTPSQFYRNRRPEYFSDSKIVAKVVLPREQLDYELMFKTLESVVEETILEYQGSESCEFLKTKYYEKINLSSINLYLIYFN